MNKSTIKAIENVKTLCFVSLGIFEPLERFLIERREKIESTQR